MATSLQEISRYSTIASIDFGTSNCSLAYRIGNRNAQNFKVDDKSERVPNAMLVRKLPGTDPDYQLIKVLGIGEDAQIRYVENRADEEILFSDCFKLMLRGDEPIHSQVRIKSGQYYLLEVISIFFRHLQKSLHNRLEMMHGTVRACDFTWVITIPAIWPLQARQFMKEAAYMAGLASGEASIREAPLKLTLKGPLKTTVPSVEEMSKVVIALEPECAALYCQQPYFNNEENIAPHCQLPESSEESRCYMVIDIGGGTVDIAIHDLDLDKHINSQSTGCHWGGYRVNKIFSQLLQRIVNDPDFKRFRSVHKEIAEATVYDAVHRSFEDCKKRFGSYSGNGAPPSNMSVRLRRKFIKFYKRRNICHGVRALRDPGITTPDGTELIITYGKMKEIFGITVANITSCISDALSQRKATSNIEMIYLVGGFGGCPYMYNEIVSHLKNEVCTVRVPLNYELAVSQGAIIYQRDPGIIKSRVSPANYGIMMACDFDQQVHEPARRYWDGAGWKVDIFRPLVKKGQIVSIHDTVSEMFSANETRDNTTIEVYRTEKEIPDGEDVVTYITDHKTGDPLEGVTKSVSFELRVPIADTSNGRVIRVEFRFGPVDIGIRACYLHTDIEIEIKFL